jgi:hypothetical protein
MPRSDAGKKRVSYNSKSDNTGKTHKENLFLKSFWSHHKMEDVINLTIEELDAKIAIWIEKFEAAQRKRTKNWTWPTYLYDPNPVKKEKGKINKKWNSSFSNK